MLHNLGYRLALDLVSTPLTWATMRLNPGATHRRFSAIACAWMLFFPLQSHALDITIGVIAGITGAGSTYGKGIVHGAEMAVREINAAGGVNGHQLKLQIADDKSDPAHSAIAMRRLVSISPDLIIGGWGSSQVLAHMDFAEQSAIPYIVVGATNPLITSRKNQWVFRVIQTDSVMAEQLARLSVQNLGMKRIAVINDSNAYGTGNRDVFVAAIEKHGANAVEIQPYQSLATDFKEQLQRIKASSPDGIAVFGTLPAAPMIMNQARMLGIKARFIGTGGLANEALIAAAPAATEGTVMMSFFHEDTDATAHAWSRRYRQEFADGRSPGPVLASWEYRAIHDIAAPCLKKSGTDRMALRDCIANWRGKLFGVSAEAYFDKSGQLVQPPLAVEIRGGAFRLFGGAQ